LGSRFVVLACVIGVAGVGVWVSHALEEREKTLLRAEVLAEMQVEQAECVARERKRQAAAAARVHKDLGAAIERSGESEAVKAVQRTLFDSVSSEGSDRDILPPTCAISIEEHARRVSARRP
jgi:hypothetical protein